MRRSLLLVGALNLGMLVAGGYTMIRGGPPEVTESSVVTPAPEAREPEAAVTEPPRGRASAGVARRPGPLARYRRRGTIVDIFCRPLPEETDQQWRERVPGYCYR